MILRYANMDSASYLHALYQPYSLADSLPTMETVTVRDQQEVMYDLMILFLFILPSSQLTNQTCRYSSHDQHPINKQTALSQIPEIGLW